MSNKIILSPDELIVCPKCNHKFALRLGITQQTIDKYESEYEAAFSAERQALEERLAKEAERKASKAFTDKITQLTEQLRVMGSGLAMCIDDRTKRELVDSQYVVG